MLDQSDVYNTPFKRAFEKSRGYTLSTPYGQVIVSDNGRSVTFRLFDDIRQSQHNMALFSYYRQLRSQGILKINCDHLSLPDTDSSLDLRRGTVRLDMVYILRGKIHEIELKTHREIGADRTRLQLSEAVGFCQNLIVVVPRRDIFEMNTILTLIGLENKVKVDTYEFDEEED